MEVLKVEVLKVEILKGLVGKYLTTLDNDEKFENWDTFQVFAKKELEGFLDWLVEQTTEFKKLEKEEDSFQHKINTQKQ